MHGLREAMARFPWLRIMHLARWLGVSHVSIKRWLKEPPNVRHFELLHDFIEGRIIPVKTGDRVSFVHRLEESDDGHLTRITNRDQDDEMNIEPLSQPVRSVVKTFSFQPDDLHLLRIAAAASGMTMSGYIREAVREKAERSQVR